jgi:hypothetical protein
MKYVPGANNNGTLTTFAGSTSGTAGTTNATGTAARFSFPYNLAIDSNSNIYVADYSNNLIRKIDSNAVVTTLTVINPAYPTIAACNIPMPITGPKKVAVNPDGTIVLATDNQNNICVYSSSNNYGTPLSYGTFPKGESIGSDMNGLLYYGPSPTADQPGNPTNVTSLYNFTFGSPTEYVLQNLSNFAISNYNRTYPSGSVNTYGIQVYVPSGTYGYTAGDIAVFSDFTSTFSIYNGMSSPILVMLDSSNIFVTYTFVSPYPAGSLSHTDTNGIEHYYGGTINFSNTSTHTTSNYSNFTRINLSPSNGYASFYTKTPPVPAWPVGSNIPSQYALSAYGFTDLFDIYNGAPLGPSTGSSPLVVSNTGYSTVTVYIPTTLVGPYFSTFSNSWTTGMPNSGAYIAYKGTSNSNIYNIVTSSNNDATNRLVFTFYFTSNTNIDGSATMSSLVFGGFTGSFSNSTPSSLGNYNGLQFFSNGTTVTGNDTAGTYNLSNTLSNYSNSDTTPTSFWFSCQVGTFVPPVTGTPNSSATISIKHLPVTSNIVTLDGTIYGTTLTGLSFMSNNGCNTAFASSLNSNVNGYTINGNTATTTYRTNVPAGFPNFVAKNPLGGEMYVTSNTQLQTYSNIY